MAENENVAVETEAPVAEVAVAEEKPSIGKRIWGGIKEYCRKSVVKLKRRPMNIAFFVLIISTVANLVSLGNYSQLGTNVRYNQQMQGLCVFINQLFSILVLLLFMNSFPKRSKKPKLVMLILCFAFMAVLMGLDIYLYVKWQANYTVDLDRGAGAAYYEELNGYYNGAMSGVLAHLILVGIAAILTATYPLYGKLINKINTRKDIGESQLSEEIDTSEEEG